jgi:hypothetical protein
MCYGACKGGRLMRLLSGVVYGKRSMRGLHRLTSIW